MIIVAGGIKGGSGKTTVATNLAVIRAAEGHDVLLVDADDQETSSDFTILRNERRSEGAGYTSIKLTGAAVRTETLRLADKYADIFIDTGGRDTTSQRAALTVAQVCSCRSSPALSTFGRWRRSGVWSVRCGGQRQPRRLRLSEPRRSARPGQR